MTTNTDTTVGSATTTDEEQVGDQVIDGEGVQDDAEAEASLAAGFARVSGKPDAEGKDDPQGQATEKSAAELQAEADARAKAEADAKVADEAARREAEWDGVPPIVRARLEKLEKLESLPGTIDKLAGHVGGFKRQLDTVLATANAAAEQRGADKPSDAQVQAARADKTGEKWKQMQEDFPEWAGAVEERLAALGAASGQPVDVEAIRRDVTQSIAPILAEVTARATASARELARIDLKHEGWEDTVKKPEFLTWSLEGGPDVARYQQIRELESTDRQKFGEATAALQADHPEWWKAKGAYIFSSRSTDAIALLDGFAEHTRKAVEATERRQRRDQRLQAAEVVRGTAEPPAVGISDEQAFGRGFNRVHRSRSP